MSVQTFRIRNLAIGAHLPQQYVQVSNREAFLALCKSFDLDAEACRNFADGLRLGQSEFHAAFANQDGLIDAAAQAGWLVHVEPQRSVSEMAIIAQEAMQPQVLSYEGPALVVACQIAREVGYSHSTAARMLHHLSRTGVSFNVGHCGLAGIFQALSVSLTLASNDGVDDVVVLAADRWPAAYSRLLSSRLVLSDGAAAASCALDRETGGANLHVMVDRLAGCPAKHVDHSSNDWVPAVAAKLIALLQAAGSARGEVLHLPPGYGRSLVAAALAREGWSEPGSSSGGLTHFGAADPLVRLSRALQPGEQSAGHVLIWDLDPVGLLGAAVLDRSAFAEIGIKERAA